MRSRVSGESGLIVPNCFLTEKTVPTHFAQLASE
jgi:hypothetical protein